MPRVICDLPNASDEISGVKFHPLEDGRRISDEINEQTAQAFLEIPGYLIDEDVDAPVQKPVEPPPVLTKAQQKAAAKAAAEKEAAEKAAAEKAAAGGDGGEGKATTGTAGAGGEQNQVF